MRKFFIFAKISIRLSLLFSSGFFRTTSDKNTSVYKLLISRTYMDRVIIKFFLLSIINIVYPISWIIKRCILCICFTYFTICFINTFIIFYANTFSFIVFLYIFFILIELIMKKIFRLLIILVVSELIKNIED